MLSILAGTIFALDLKIPDPGLISQKPNQRNYPIFSELAVLCAFARIVVYPIT
jgi:hypothetical protein